LLITSSQKISLWYKFESIGYWHRMVTNSQSAEKEEEEEEEEE
jgi:hypothetical protein